MLPLRNIGAVSWGDQGIPYGGSGSASSLKILLLMSD
jgi:hypothetical protein